MADRDAADRAWQAALDAANADSAAREADRIWFCRRRNARYRARRLAAVATLNIDQQAEYHLTESGALTGAELAAKMLTSIETVRVAIARLRRRRSVTTIMRYAATRRRRARYVLGSQLPAKGHHDASTRLPRAPRGVGGSLCRRPA